MSDWQLDRLPGDVRQEAENAAQRDSLPLHRWLGRLIRESCADEGIALARELSPNLIREPAESGERDNSVPPRSTQPIRVPIAARFAERAAMPNPPRQPANANDGSSAATARPSEPDEPPFAAEMPRRPIEPPAQPPRGTEPARTAPRRFANVPRMPEPRVAEALHVVEPRPAASPRPAVRVAATAREAIARDIAAVRSAAMARGADITPSPASPPASFAPSPVSPQSTPALSAAQSPESSLSTAAESWSARRARGAATGRSTAPRRDAGVALPRPARDPIPSSSASAHLVAPPFTAPLGDRSALPAKLVEGLRRNELSAVGEARLFLKLMTEHMASVGDITAATGRTPEQVARSLRLLGLSDRLRDLIDRGALSREQAFALLDAEQASPHPTPPSGHRLP